MKALLLSDNEYPTRLYEELISDLSTCLTTKDFILEDIRIGRDDLAPCMGCFGCWIKNPGECVINDLMARINQTYINSDVTIYICPIVFGQCSANIKNALDRWIPNILPFFKHRPDGSTTHPPRYAKYPKQIMIGYGDELTPEEEQLFTDIVRKHRNDIELMVYRDKDSDVAGFVNKLSLRKERIKI